MKTSVEEINAVQRRIKIELSPEDVQSAFEQAYRSIQKKAAIKGFRAGKAPMNIIKKFYGGSVAYEVADDLVKRHLFKTIEAEKIRPVAAPVLETAELPKEGKEYSFSAVVDVMPALAISGYKGLNLSFTPNVVDEAAVESEITNLRRRQAKQKEAAEGSTATAGHAVTLSHSVQKDGVDAPEMTAKDVSVVLGEKQLHPELEAAVIGMKQGETKTVDITLDENFQDPSLRNSTLSFTLTLDGLHELVLPEADDEFAKDLGLDSLATLKTNIRDTLSKQAEQNKRNQLETQLLNQLVDKNNFDVPPSIVDQVIDSMIDELRWPSERERQAARVDQDLRQSCLESAKAKAKNTLILHEIIKNEKLEVSEADVDAFAREISGAKAEDLTEKALANIKKQLGAHVRENLLFNKALDFVIANAKVQESSPA